MVMPNFLIIGAPKSGTTALYHMLDAHPEIYMSSEKEPFLFALDFEQGERFDFRGPGDMDSLQRRHVSTLDAYQRLFEGATTEKVIGEATTCYLYIPSAPARIQRHLPEVKLIAMLRDPVERAYSAYWHQRRNGHETLTDFMQAMQAEATRIQNRWKYMWRYQDMGLYYQQVKRYYDAFDANQIRIYLYDDFCVDKTSILRDIFQFLGVQSNVEVGTRTKFNSSGTLKSKAIQTFLQSPHPFLKRLLPHRSLRKRINATLQSLNLKGQPMLPDEQRQQLIPLFRDDILRLEELLDRDLSSWLR